jgi:hypothetical protein
MLQIPGACQGFDDVPRLRMTNAEVGTVQSGELDLANPDEFHGVTMIMTVLKQTV